LLFENNGISKLAAPQAGVFQRYSNISDIRRAMLAASFSYLFHQCDDCRDQAGDCRDSNKPVMAARL
jgi:hypothetical protein